MDVIHACPPADEAVTPCCGASPFELLRDRITLKPEEVTCTGADRSQPLTVYIAPQPYVCDGSHGARNISYLGEHHQLEVEICSDPQCAYVVSRCTHPSQQNFWNEDGTVLTCGFCRRDCT